ncbi:MAG: hypothetical protein SGCHY_000188 [Lobulomycetales sp.]
MSALSSFPLDSTQKTLLLDAAMLGAQLSACLLGLVLFSNPALRIRARPRGLKAVKVVVSLAGLLNGVLVGVTLYDSSLFGSDCRPFTILTQASLHLLFMAMDTAILARTYHTCILQFSRKSTRYLFHAAAFILMANRACAALLDILHVSDRASRECSLIQFMPFSIWWRAADLAIFLLAAWSAIGRMTFMQSQVPLRDYSHTALLLKGVVLIILSAVGMAFQPLAAILDAAVTIPVLRAVLILQVFLILFEQGLNRTVETVSTGLCGSRRFAGPHRSPNTGTSPTFSAAKESSSPGSHESESKHDYVMNKNGVIKPVYRESYYPPPRVSSESPFRTGIDYPGTMAGQVDTYSQYNAYNQYQYIDGYSSVSDEHAATEVSLGPRYHEISKAALVSPKYTECIELGDLDNLDPRSDVTESIQSLNPPIEIPPRLDSAERAGRISYPPMWDSGAQKRSSPLRYEFAMPVSPGLSEKNFGVSPTPTEETPTEIASQSGRQLRSFLLKN